MRRRRKKGGKRDEIHPAPGDLRVVQAFVNTIDLETETEDLSGPSALADWFSSRGLFDSETGALVKADLERALEVRSALRRLLSANGGAVVDEATFRCLDRVASAGRFRLRFTREGARFETLGKSFDNALGRLLEIVATALREGEWGRLRLCASGDCRTAFFDASKNGTKKWCTSRCGVKQRVRSYRRTPQYQASRLIDRGRRR